MQPVTKKVSTLERSRHSQSMTTDEFEALRHLRTFSRTIKRLGIKVVTARTSGNQELFRNSLQATLSFLDQHEQYFDPLVERLLTSNNPEIFIPHVHSFKKSLRKIQSIIL